MASTAGDVGSVGSAATGCWGVVQRRQRVSDARVGCSRVFALLVCGALAGTGDPREACLVRSTKACTSDCGSGWTSDGGTGGAIVVRCNLDGPLASGLELGHAAAWSRRHGRLQCPGTGRRYWPAVFALGAAVSRVESTVEIPTHPSACVDPRGSSGSWDGWRRCGVSRRGGGRGSRWCLMGAICCCLTPPAAMHGEE